MDREALLVVVVTVKKKEGSRGPLWPLECRGIKDNRYFFGGFFF